MKTKTFILIGAAGYAAQKHLSAIKNIGGKVTAVIDPNDNLEILDEYFPESEYFKSIEEAQAFIRSNTPDYIVVCTPTHLHAGHITFALYNKCDVICESPMVLSSAEYENIRQLEIETGKKVFNILQYRNHSELEKLKEEITTDTTYDIQIINHSYRGKWFKQSWKGNPEKSGGLLTVFGYHFFDALIWMFGTPVKVKVENETEQVISGMLYLPNAKVRFSLGDNKAGVENAKQLTFVVNNKDIDLSFSSNYLVTCYESILAGKGWQTSELKETINLLS